MIVPRDGVGEHTLARADLASLRLVLLASSCSEGVQHHSVAAHAAEPRPCTSFGGGAACDARRLRCAPSKARRYFQAKQKLQLTT